jgi:arsenite methyltransferase
MAEFDGERSKLYNEALKEYPNARKQDIEVMQRYLAPKKGETILEVGAGSGFFSGHIADILGNNGKLIVSDPSSGQLESIKDLNRGNIEVSQKGAEDINLEDNIIDAIWSFGAMHHCFNKERALEKFRKVLKNKGRIVICDVFEGSKLAEHFDKKVDEYCITGHNVEFWTEKIVKDNFNKLFANIDYTLSMPELNIKWIFKTEEDIGKFLYKLHGMTKTTPKVCLEGARKILGIKKVKDKYELNWPMKAIIIE